jgi:Anti-sigma-K factor rskA, C-terminal
MSAKRSVDALLTAQTDRIALLQAESSNKRQEVDKLRGQLRILQDHRNEERRSAQAGFDDLVAAKAGVDEQLRKISLETERLFEQLRDTRRAYQNAQNDLATLRAERDKAMLRLASLDTRLSELTATNHDQERRLRNSDQFLSSDRDIRELMGARNLYIADVFDVDSSSRTRKPYGRVFYTRGKSLIFYAFDLDRQPKAKSSSAFQVWGRKETIQGEPAKPLNLGILYLDSEANRRWILRFDDPQTLAEISAVFVTVEPHGGSPKPTGAPLLFAMLRIQANHP